jgi:WD40 repeat protein
VIEERAAASRATGDGRHYDVFVSYNRADTPAVERIARRLRGEGLEVFFDRWAVAPGRSWQEDILRAMGEVAACAVFIGREGLGDWAREELAVAQSRATKDPRFRLFMVLLPGAPSPLDPRLAFLSTRSWVDLRPEAGRGNGFEDLLAAVTGVPRHSQPASVDGASCPYRGLESFDERHAGLFFGREDETRRLCERLSDARFLAVIGPSGSGKSSVVKAGLIPALRADALAHSGAWTIRTMTPGGRPLAGLAALMMEAAAGDSMQRTVDALATDERTVDLAVALALGDRPAGQRFVLVVDQLEELFTLCRDEDERSAFLSSLVYAATIPGGRTIVVVTLRADFYDRCAPYPSVRSVLAPQQMLIGPLSEDGLRRAIEEPAWAVGLTLEPGLVDTILADVGDRPGALPLLQHVLVQVWRRRRGTLLTLEAYVESGGVQGALAKHADAVYERLSEGERDVTERVLLRLVQPGEGTEDARRRVNVDELLTAGDEPSAVEAVVRTLADERLLTTSRDELSEARLVEITHEALLQGWPRLRRWIERDREALLAHRRLTEASRDWERSGRDQALLYRGTRLAAWRPPGGAGLRSRRARLTETVEWRARRNRSLNQLEREFLDASDRREQREQTARRRRLRLVFAGLAVALLAITSVAIVAVHQGNQAKRQRDIAVSRDLADSSHNVLKTDPELSLALARRAVDMSPTPQAATALRQAVLGFRGLAVLRSGAASMLSADLSPNGRLAVGASNDGKLFVWDLRKDRLVMRSQAHRGRAMAARFSPDGRLVASAGDDGAVEVTDVATGRRRVLISDRKAHASSLAFARDGSRMVGGYSDGTVRVASLRPGARVQVLNGGRVGVAAVAFDPDGGRVASASDDGVVRVWPLSRSSPPLVLHSDPRGDTSVSFSPDGRRLISADVDGWLHVWSIATTAGEVEVPAERRIRINDQVVYAAQFSPDGKRIAVADADGTVRIVDAAGERVTAILRGHAGRAFDVRFSRSGSVVISAGEDATVRTWDPGRTEVMGGPVTTVRFSPDGRRVVAGDQAGAVRIWDVASGRMEALLRGQRLPSLPRFSPDGRRVISASYDGTVRIWAAPDWRTERVFRDNGPQVYAAAFDHHARRFASGGSDGRVIVRTLTGSAPPLVFTGHNAQVSDVGFSPDDRRLISASVDGTIRIWDLRHASARPVVLRGHRGPVESAAFSPDGQRIVSAGDDGTVRIWTLRDHRSVVLRGHNGNVMSAAFNPRGDRVVSAGIDGLVQIWDPRGGVPLLTLLRHHGPAYNAAFSPEGTTVISGGNDGTWLSPCDACGSLSDVLQLARKRAERELTATERQRFG